MKAFFADTEKQAALDNDAHGWQGTPFFKGACERGRAVDCVHYAYALMVARGALPAGLKIPGYTLDHGHHCGSQMLPHLLTAPEFKDRLKLVPPFGERLPGDIYGLRSGNCDHHLAVHLPGNRVTHATESFGVITHAVTDRAFQIRVLYILRPVVPMEATPA